MDENIIDQFLNKKNIFAVIGVSNDQQKYGRKVFDKLKSAGYTVYPINPKEKFIDGNKCYSTLKDLPSIPDVVSFVVPFQVGEKVMLECEKLGIKKIWLQPGSESDKIIEFCNNQNIACLHDQCIIINI